MNINELNGNYLNELLDKLSKENKTIFLLGDFNFNLLNYDIHPPTNEFLVSLSSHFCNMAVPNTIYSNLTASILDDLPQFLVARNIFFNVSYPKSNNYERDWSRFDQENFALYYFLINWDNLLLSSNTITEKPYKTFLEMFESLLDTYTPLKKFQDKSLKIGPG